MSYPDQSYATVTAIIILFIFGITSILLYLFCPRSTASPRGTTLRTWTNYAEAIRQDPRAASVDSCAICLTNYNEEEEGENNALKILPGCGHVFHAICVDQWLRQYPTCPICRSPVTQGWSDSIWNLEWRFLS